MVIAEQGGIYFDTDVELIRPIDELLTNPAFFGFEDSEHVATGLGFGAEPGNPAVQAMLREYDVLFQGDIPAIGCPILNTAALVKMGLCLNGEKQDLGVAIVYPADFFNPYDDPTGRLSKTNNTISIHWYSKSWMSKYSVLRSKLTKPLHRLLGKDFFRKGKSNCQWSRTYWFYIIEFVLDCENYFAVTASSRHRFSFWAAIHGCRFLRQAMSHSDRILSATAGW